jgi:hypothetical protein
MNFKRIAFVIVTVIFVFGVLYVVQSKAILRDSRSDFWKSLQRIEKGDSLKIRVSRTLSPPGGRLSAESAPLESVSGIRYNLKAKVNMKYDPIQSSIRTAMEIGDSILLPMESDTICLKKSTGEFLYYRIMYPEN